MKGAFSTWLKKALGITVMIKVPDDKQVELISIRCGLADAQIVFYCQLLLFSAWVWILDSNGVRREIATIQQRYGIALDLDSGKSENEDQRYIEHDVT